MKPINNIDQKVDEIMHSFDGAQRAEGNPFLFTKVMAKINSTDSPSNIWNKIMYFITRPAFFLSIIFLICAMNFIAIQNKQHSSQENTLVTTATNEFGNMSSIYADNMMNK